VFSKSKIGNKPRSAAKLTTHITGGKVHVTCRLPQPAKAYAPYLKSVFNLQLVSERGNTQWVVSQQTLGYPGKFGKARYVSGTFTLPPPKYGKEARWLFRGQVQHTRALHDDHLLSSGQFTWHR